MSFRNKFVQFTSRLKAGREAKKARTASKKELKNQLKWIDNQLKNMRREIKNIDNFVPSKNPKDKDRYLMDWNSSYKGLLNERAELLKKIREH